MKDAPVLFSKKENCCGCGACFNICPKNAISMEEDECGFLYPRINENKCIHCGLCKTVCAFQNKEETNNPIACFAARSKNEKRAEKSASAGIFAAIAHRILEQGGIVYGAAFTDDWGVQHIRIDRLADLEKLQGSKYAQSSTGNTFSDVKTQLNNNKRILYSGTPCQIAALKEYLGRDYDSLITVDIVCHGVPSSKMLRDYLKSLENKYNGRIEYFVFRDKSLGWGKNGSFVINENKNVIWESESPYFYYFSKGWLSRENCYKCKYTSSHRPADITLGDYWGIEKQHPDLLKKENWDESRGISAVIVNTEKGIEALNEIKDCIQKEKTEFSQIAANNSQLRHPCSPGKRDEIIRVYLDENWKGVENRFAHEIGFRKYSSRIKAFIPKTLKRKLKSLK